ANAVLEHLDLSSEASNKPLWNRFLSDAFLARLRTNGWRDSETGVFLSLMNDASLREDSMVEEILKASTDFLSRDQLNSLDIETFEAFIGHPRSAIVLNKIAQITDERWDVRDGAISVTKSGPQSLMLMIGRFIENTSLSFYRLRNAFQALGWDVESLNGSHGHEFDILIKRRFREGQIDDALMGIDYLYPNPVGSGALDRFRSDAFDFYSNTISNANFGSREIAILKRLNRYFSLSSIFKESEKTAFVVGICGALKEGSSIDNFIDLLMIDEDGPDSDLKVRTVMNQPLVHDALVELVTRIDDALAKVVAHPKNIEDIASLVATQLWDAAETLEGAQLFISDEELSIHLEESKERIMSVIDIGSPDADPKAIAAGRMTVIELRAQRAVEILDSTVIDSVGVKEVIRLTGLPEMLNSLNSPPGSSFSQLPLAILRALPRVAKIEDQGRLLVEGLRLVAESDIRPGAPEFTEVVDVFRDSLSEGRYPRIRKLLLRLSKVRKLSPEGGSSNIQDNDLDSIISALHLPQFSRIRDYCKAILSSSRQKRSS
ncbi:MAG: hypothetical protein KDD42_02915, partial [Bdellovibrionales bacterium]|nr:hypothetical protein [Bdellovibrionales bacterium]